MSARGYLLLLGGLFGGALLLTTTGATLLALGYAVADGRPDRWWALGLIALGCAAAWVLVVVLWRRRARRGGAGD